MIELTTTIREPNGVAIYRRYEKVVDPLGKKYHLRKIHFLYLTKDKRTIL